jgi:hypothetical protein
MTPSTIAALVKTFESCCSIMGLNQGTMGFTKFPNQYSITIDIIKNYGQIDKPMLKAHCNEFCKAAGAKIQMCVAQNNHMMAQHLRPASSPTKRNTCLRALNMCCSCTRQS